MRPRHHPSGRRAEMTFAVTFCCPSDDEPRMATGWQRRGRGSGETPSSPRSDRICAWRSRMPVLERTFAMAKIRVAESINATRGGLMLAPGGLSFYAATWCNDNVEYAGPFFPFLGDDGRQCRPRSIPIAATRAFMTPDYHAIPSSIVAEGTDTWHGAGDRGDAAMYAYGCARFCLARGDRAIARGAVARPSPGAWSTAGGRPGPTERSHRTAMSWKAGSRPGRPTSRPSASTTAACARRHTWRGRSARSRRHGATINRRRSWRPAIERYVRRHHRGLRHLPLLRWQRRPALVDLPAAVHGPDGTPRRHHRRAVLRHACGAPTAWPPRPATGCSGTAPPSTGCAVRVPGRGDRAGAARYLIAYSHGRLLGEHVPYAVETGKQGSQLSSESGLYCRIFIDGLFGVLPTGLDRFACTPRLPNGWPSMALRSVRAFGRTWDLAIARQGDQLRVTATVAGRPAIERLITPGATADITLP
jgi:hypothetical protein